MKRVEKLNICKNVKLNNHMENIYLDILLCSKVFSTKFREIKMKSE